MKKGEGGRVARPIAKRRAGLLGGITPPDGGKDSRFFGRVGPISGG
jgi:hypothetical protein